MAWESRDGGLVLLRKGDKPRRRGTWFPLIADDQKTATVTCPDCGLQGTLESHKIHEDGRVSPSVNCPDPECSWHVWIRLEGWADG
jgi:hypothetical protein